jgi:hypothetical protein
MKRFLQTLTIAFICGVIATPMAEASDRHNPGGGRGERTSNSVGTPSRSSNPGAGTVNPGRNDGGSRPGNGTVNPGRNDGGSRPGNGAVNPGRNGGSRPGNGAVNPGNNGGSRPGGAVNPGNNGGSRPGGAVNPGHNGGPRPGGNVNPGRPGNPGRQPGMMPGRSPRYGWVRPVAPTGWRPGPRAPRFTSILGLTLGMAYDLSLDYLYSNYNVYSYGSNVVYLNNVRQLNYMWPAATVYFDGGTLGRGEFYYSTDYYDTARYNSVYADLVRAYGAPITKVPITRANGGYSQWFGPDGRYVTLEYQPQSDGYCTTTLSFGI